MVKSRQRTALWVSLAGLVGLGCGDGISPPASIPAPGSPAASTFDPATAGTVQGRVTWEGPLPAVPPFQVRPWACGGEGFRTQQTQDNPNAPRLDPATGGVADAVVYLKNVDPRTTRPWDLPPVRAEQTERRLQIRQGNDVVRSGFVRRGDPVEMVSYDEVFHALRAGGAAFFTLAFPDPYRPRRRNLTERGRVELSSGAGFYWMRAYLFVDDHPYYARTSADGRFTLPGVPPGRYEVVCWAPNWHPAEGTRNPESTLIDRLTFRPPGELTRSVELSPGGRGEVSFTLSSGLFE